MPTDLTYADLEIGLRRVQSERYEVELRFRNPESETEIPPARGEATFALGDFTVYQLDAEAYGKALAAVLFAQDAIRGYFRQVKTAVEAGDLHLRLRLRLTASSNLQALRWELLRDPDSGKALATSERILFSRFMASSDWRPVKLQPKSDLRALIAVSSPSDLGEGKKYEQAEIDAEGEIARARAALEDARVEVAGKDEPLTLNHLVERMRDGIDVLYLVCHGVLSNRGVPALYLQKTDGTTAVTRGADLADRMADLAHPPRLVFLASCESAGTESGTDALGDATAQASLAPRLAEAGVPAIVAMQGQISMETIEQAAPMFFRELMKDGVIDRALAVARGAVRDRPDSWMPALFLRLRNGRIWLAETPGLPTIPPPTRDFTGRTVELEELRQAIGEHGGALIYAVRGLGGIGKTELGLKLVELVGDEYPDGHILVELGGASNHPLSTAAAMASVIRAYEPQLRLPEGEEDLRRLYHQALKDRGAIVLLDDAAGAKQVEPLLPHTDCLTLVTSRKRFALPKLHRLDLDALTPEAARELLLSLAPRLGAEAERIAELLGRLPLALRLAGSAFAERPDLEPDEYVHRLESRDERVGLVEAAISFNYEALSPEQQRLWRALAVFPGDFDIAGAATVWAVEHDAAREVLGDGLYPVSLVEYRSGRHRLHDLARDFAASRLEDEERQATARRHAGHYVEVLMEADRLYRKGGRSLLKGLTVLDTEWGNIRAGQAWAAEHAETDREAAEHCSTYAAAAVDCLSLRLHPNAEISWLEVGRSGAASLGDRRGEANALGNLGCAYAAIGEVQKAIGYFEQHLVIARQIGDRDGEGAALGNLGSAYFSLGRIEKATGYYRQRLDIAREIDDRHGEGNALGSLGLVYAALGKVEKAIGYFEQALVTHRETGNWHSEGMSLGNLGLACSALGEVQKAIGYFEQHLVIARQIGDRRGEGAALGNLGGAYYSLGEVGKAIANLEQQLIIEVGDRRGESAALGNLGNAYYSLMEVEKAIGYYEQTLVIYREIGDRHGEGKALGNLGSAYATQGDVEKAIGCLEQALAIGQAIKDPRVVSASSEQLDRLRES